MSFRSVHFMSRFFLLAGDDRPLALHTLGERLCRYLMKREGSLSLLCLYTFLKMNICGSIYRLFCSGSGCLSVYDTALYCLGHYSFTISHKNRREPCSSFIILSQSRFVHCASFVLPCGFGNPFANFYQYKNHWNLIFIVLDL